MYTNIGFVQCPDIPYMETYHAQTRFGVVNLEGGGLSETLSNTVIEKKVLFDTKLNIFSYA